MDMNDSMSGYKKLKNDKGYTIQSLLEQLNKTEFSFGKPSVGKTSKKQAILFEPVGNFRVYIYVNEDSIEIGRTVVGNMAKTLFKEIALSFVTKIQDKDAAAVDRAVDEVYEVIDRLLKTGTAHNNSSAPVATSLYMRQRLSLIKEKFDICTEDQEPVYWVESNVTSLGFSVQDAFGNELMEIKKKLVAVTPEYTILRDGEKIGEIKKKIRLTRPEISGTVEGNEIEIKGDLMGYHFAIKCNDVVIANVDSTRLVWGDVYSIDIVDESKQDLIAVIAIIVDNTLKNRDDGPAEYIKPLTQL